MTVTTRGAMSALAAILFALPFAASADTELFTTTPDLNPGFETGTGNDATGWTTSSIGTITAAFTPFANGTNAHNGAGRSAVVTVTAGGGAGTEAKWLSPAIAVTPGQFINVSDFYKSDVPTSVFIYPGPGSTFTQPQWVGDAAASPSAFTQFHGSTYQVPAGVVSIEIGHTISAVGSLTTDDYSAMLIPAPNLTEGHVTLSFDDGWKSQFVNLNALGTLKATFYIITGPLGSNIEAPGTGVPDNADYMTLADIQALQAAGEDVAAHTRSHPAGGLAAPGVDLSGEVNGSRQDLLTHALSPVDNFAYPEGIVNPTIEAAVTSAGFAGARGIAEGFNDKQTDPYDLKAYEVYSDTPLSTIQTLVEQALTSKTWVIFFFHHVNATCPGGAADECITPASLQAITTYLQGKPAGTVITVSQGLTLIKGGTVTPPPPPPVTHAITPSSDANGTISPAVVTQVADAGTQAFTFAANPGYHFATLTVDNAAAATTSLNTYTFTNVTAAHTIAVTYAQDVDTTAPTVTLSSSAPVAPAQTNMSPIPVTVQFSEAVTGFEASDVTVSGGTLTNFATTSNSASFNVTPSADGTVTVSVASGAAQDLATTPNQSTASNILTFNSNRTVSVITLNGDAYVSVLVGGTYTEQGAAVSGTTTPATITGTVNTAVMGTSTITYSFTDFAGNVSAPITRTVVTTDLSNITDEASSNVTNSSVTITWTTTASGTSRVIYDTVSHDPLTATSTNYGYANSTTEDSATTTQHSVTITGLTAGTKYYFRTISHASPEVVSSQSSFTTAGNPAPVVSGGSTGGSGGGGGNGPISGSLGGGGFGGFYNFGGTVLGASTTGGNSGNASNFKFLKDLWKGMRNNDVSELQKRLIAEGLLSIDAPTGYFGNLTFAAVKGYQKGHALPQVGRVGPRTRAALNGENTSMSGNNTALLASLKAQLKVLMDKIAAMMAVGSASSTTSTSTSMMSTSTMSTTGATSTGMTSSSTMPVTATSTATSTSTL